MNLADLYSTLETIRRNGKGLLNDPAGTLGMWGNQIKEDLGQYGQRNASAMNAIGDNVSGLLGVPSAGQQAFDNNKSMGLLGLHIAYHGTPHVVDKFDSSKIGTGEGAQAYGHGLYFAENPSTAAAYQSALGGTAIETPAGKVTTRTASGPEKTAANWVDFFHQAGDPNPVLRGYMQAKRSGEDEATLGILGGWVKDQAKVGQAGNLYKVDINADPAHYLDWDKPLSQQSPKVQDALS